MRMKQTILALGLGLSCFGLPATAFAADPGFYIGGGGGQARHSGDFADQLGVAYTKTNEYALLSADLTDRNDDAWKLFAGYRFGNGFGLELSFVDFGSAASQYHMRADVPWYPSPEYRVEGRYDVEAFGLSAFYEWAFSPSFSAIVRAGLFDARQDYSQYSLTEYDYDFRGGSDDTVPGFGLGLNWRMTPSLDLRLDYDHYQNVGKRFAFEEDTNGSFDLGVASLNLAWRFGR